MMSTVDEVGIAIEDNYAVVVRENSFNILKSDKNANAYKIFKPNDKIQKQPLINYEFINIAKLFKR